MKRIAAIAVVIAFGLAACTGGAAQRRSSPEQPGARNVLTTLHSVADLKAAFNRSAGEPRLVLLLSPT